MTGLNVSQNDLEIRCYEEACKLVAPFYAAMKPGDVLLRQVNPKNGDTVMCLVVPQHLRNWLARNVATPIANGRAS
jgi:hypothetical protein